MGEDPDARVELGRRWRELHELGVGVGQGAQQQARADAAAHGLHHAEQAVHPHGDARGVDVAGQPLRLLEVGQALVRGHPGVVFEARLAAARLQVALRCVQRGAHVADMPPDQVLGRPVGAAHRHVGLAARQAQERVVHGELHLHARVQLAKTRQQRHQHAVRQRVGRRETQRALHLHVEAHDLPVRGVDLLAHTGQALSDVVAGRGERIAAGQAVEEPHRDAVLEAADAAQHGGMVHAQRAGGARHRAVLHHGQEHLHVVPAQRAMRIRIRHMQVR